MKTIQKLKQTEIGEIPEDWEVNKLMDFIEINKGQQLNRAELTPTGEYPDWNGGVQQSGYTPLWNTLENTITISEGGNSCGFVNYCKTKFWLGGHCYSLKIIDKTNKKFLFQLLKFKERFIMSLRIGSGLPNIQKNELNKFLLLRPKDIKEQDAIAQVLSDTDTLIESLNKLIEKKKNIKQGAMQQLLTGKKRLKRLTGKWEEETIESLCISFTKQTGFDYSAYIKPKLVSKFKKGTIPFIQNKDFKAKKINFNTDYYIPEDVAISFPRILLDERCLLISISGCIGNVGIFCNSQKAFIGGAVAVAKFRDKKQLDWIMYYLLSDEGQIKLLNQVKAGSHQNLILEDIRKITIPIPSEIEQKNITNFLSDMDVEIEDLERKRDKYLFIKKGMMQELLTGRIRLKYG